MKVAWNLLASIEVRFFALGSSMGNDLNLGVFKKKRLDIGIVMLSF